MSTELTVQLENFQTTLQTNENYVTKYNSQLTKILGKHTGGLLTVEKDEELMKFQVSASKCVKVMNEARAPYTRKMDEIKKQFTAQETILSDLGKKVQSLRDESAKIKLDKERKESEVSQLQIVAENRLKQLYADTLTQDKNKFLTVVTNGDLSTIEEELLLLKPDLTEVVFNHICSQVIISSQYGNDIDEIKKKAFEGKHELLRPHYVTAINAQIKYVISLIPGLKEGLEVKEEVVPVAITEKEVPVIASKPKHVREKLSLEVISDDGWLQVVQMYFRDNSSVAANTTLEKMRKYCESISNSTGEVLDNGVVYTEIVKAGIKRK